MDPKSCRPDANSNAANHPTFKRRRQAISARVASCSGTLQVLPRLTRGKSRYTRNLMVRRLSAFALALVILGAPVAATVCQARCAEPKTPDMSGTVGHVHHHHSFTSSVPSPRGAAAGAAAPLCGPRFGDTTAVPRSLEGLDAPALVAVPPSLAPPVLSSLVLRSACVEHSPPGSLALVTQLRV